MNIPYIKQFNELGEIINSIEKSYMSEYPNRRERRHSEKRLNTNKPANSTRANSVLESEPPAQRALKTTLKTNVYTASIRTGLKKDHIKPIAEPR